MEEGDFAKRNQDSFRSLEKGKPRFVVHTNFGSGGLPSSEERKTKDSFGGLLTKGNQDSIGWTSDEWFRGNEREAKMKGKRKRKGKGKKERKMKTKGFGWTSTNGTKIRKYSESWIGWASEERKNPRFVSIRSGGLPKIGKRRTKVRLGCLECLPKNRKTKIRFRWVSEEQKTQRFVRTVSGGFLKNGKYTNLNGFDPGSVFEGPRRDWTPISKVYFGN
ncbi:unnamed protein product [Rhizophagus irregularis]|nr:unnamed protein product [Rhizophagus irregularis]